MFFAILIGGRIYRTIQKAKKAVEQAAEQQEQQRRTETGRQRQQYSQRAQASQSSQDAYSSSSQREEEPQARRTQTATGETIIDNRHQERENQKIFDDSDGEYVEYTEV